MVRDMEMIYLISNCLAHNLSHCKSQLFIDHLFIKIMAICTSSST
nr:MAG TPA: hypothetical protein [Caudoviricetes sp.]